MTHRTRRFKDDAFEQFARVGKAFSSPRRLELLDVLCQGPRTVEVLAEQTSMTVSNASQHLKVLHATRLVDAHRDGLHVTYRVASPKVAALYHQLRALAEQRLTEIEALRQDHLGRRGALEAVDGDELLRRALAGEVTVIDVRPREEFDAGHLPGARPVPLAELEEALAGLPRHRPIVAYCGAGAHAGDAGPPGPVPRFAGTDRRLKGRSQGTDAGRPGLRRHTRPARRSAR